MTLPSAPKGPMSPRAALMQPSTAFLLLSLLPVLGAARWRPDIVLCLLVWVAFCRVWMERWFGAARPDLPQDAPRPGQMKRLRGHVAIQVATLVGAVAIVFVRSWEMWVPLLLIPAPVLLADTASIKLRGRFHGAYSRFPSLSVLLCGLITFGAYGSWVDRGAPDMNDDFLYALRANELPKSLSIEERNDAIAIVRSVLSGSPAPQAQGRLAAPHPERVWVTLFRQARKARWVRGYSEDGTLAERLRAAAEMAKASAPSGRWPANWSSVRIQVDLEGPSQRLGSRWFRVLVARIGESVAGDHFVWRFVQYDDEAGVDGFRMTESGREATVLPADPLIDSWFTPRSLKKRFRVDNWWATRRELGKRGGFEPTQPWPPGATLENFRTYSFAQPDPEEARTVELYRGNVLFEGELDEARLLTGIASAGEWLLGTVEDDGRFDYEYFPTSDDHGRGYNEVRHAGSVYGLFHLARMAEREPSLQSRRNAYIEAGILALDRVYSMLGSPPGTEGDHVAFLQTRRKGVRVDTGAQALTLLSFLERPPADSVTDPELAARLWRDGDDAIIAGLARTLIALVDERGWVYKRWENARSGEVMERQPLYYPGELMLALVRFFEETGDLEALETARHVGRAQIAYAHRPWEIPDHWVMQALDLLDKHDPEDPTWRDGAYEMGMEYTSEQFPPQMPHANDYRGAYRRDLEIARTTRAASRGEAIGGVARIAWRRGDPSDRWERSLIEGARHLIEQQYTADNSFTFPNPAEGLGAIRMGLIDNHCRIDNNQHGVVALNAALEALRRQGGSP